MSKTAILQELPKLGLQERREIFERICELEENDILRGGEPTPEERALLDRELEEYRRNPSAGSPWHEVEARIGKPPASSSSGFCTPSATTRGGSDGHPRTRSN